MFSNDRFWRDMGLGNRELGEYLMNLIDSDRVSRYNSNLEYRNMAVIRWLAENDAPEELIEQAKKDEAQGINAILNVVDEIRMCGVELVVVPAEVVKLIPAALGPVASAYLIQLCEEYEDYAGGSDKDCRG